MTDVIAIGLTLPASLYILFLGVRGDHDLFHNARERAWAMVTGFLGVVCALLLMAGLVA